MQNVVVQQAGYTRSGEYGATGRSNVIAAGLAANSEIFHFRWTDAGSLALVTELAIWAGNDGTAFTAGSFLFRAQQSRSWSADGTGGNTSNISGNNGKIRTSFPTTLVGTIRVSDTGGLGAGTKTNDLNGFFELGGGATAVAGASLISPSGFFIGGGAGPRYPITLAQNEGIVITAVVPATGTWRFGVSVRWEETRGYRL